MSESAPAKKRGRPPLRTGVVVMPVRLSKDFADRIDAIAERHGRDHLGNLNVTRSDLMRRYLEAGVAADEERGS